MDLGVFSHDPAVEDLLFGLLPHGPPEYQDESDAESVFSMIEDKEFEGDLVRPSTAFAPTFDEVDNWMREILEPPAIFTALHGIHDILCLSACLLKELYVAMATDDYDFRQNMPPLGHVNGGSMANTTDRMDYLFGHKEFKGDEIYTSPPQLRVADDTIHRPLGKGYLKIPVDKGSGYLLAKAYYTPQIPATILSPDAMAKAFRCRAYQTYSDFVGDQTRLTLVSCNSEADNISIALQHKRGLLFTDPLLMPTDADRVAISSNAPACRATCCGESTSSTCDLCLPVSQVTASPPDGSDLFPSWRSTIIDPLEDYMCPQHINALTNDQRRALWHLRLGHINLPQVVNAHKFADGIPKLPRHDVLHSCPMCLRSKLHKAPSNKTEDIDLDGAECWQHVQMDFGFIVQKSRCLDEEEADAEAMGMTTIRLPRLVFMSWELAMLLSQFNAAPQSC